MSIILPVEQATNYASFGFSPLNAGEFDSPPLVLLVGPYSAGKTTFIEHLVGKKFPGQRIGPEPTTDKFCAVLHGKDERVIPGNALTVTPGTPFKGVQMFGNNFLTRFEGAQVDSDILKNLTLIDSPGVLSGEKQTLGRSYSYDDVLNWFAERSDMIILLFDVQKLDISDEMSSAIRVLQVSCYTFLSSSSCCWVSSCWCCMWWFFLLFLSLPFLFSFSCFSSTFSCFRRPTAACRH